MKAIPLREALKDADLGDAAVRVEDVRAYFDRFSRRRYLRAQAAMLLLFAGAILGLQASSGRLSAFLAVIAIGFPLGYWRQTRVVLGMSVARRLEEAGRLEALLGLSAAGFLAVLGGIFVLKGRLPPASWASLALASLLSVPALGFTLAFAARTLARRWDPYRMD